MHYVFGSTKKLRNRLLPDHWTNNHWNVTVPEQEQGRGLLVYFGAKEVPVNFTNGFGGNPPVPFPGFRRKSPGVLILEPFPVYVYLPKDYHSPVIPEVGEAIAVLLLRALKDGRITGLWSNNGSNNKRLCTELHLFADTQQGTCVCKHMDTVCPVLRDPLPSRANIRRGTLFRFPLSVDAADDEDGRETESQGEEIY